MTASNVLDVNTVDAYSRWLRVTFHKGCWFHKRISKAFYVHCTSNTMPPCKGHIQLMVVSKVTTKDVGSIKAPACNLSMYNDHATL